MTDDEQGDGIQTLQKTIDIIDGIQSLDGARVTELADHLDLPASTVHNHLATLEQNKLLVKEGDVYHIGLAFLHLGGYAAHRKQSYSEAIDKVQEIAKETGERAQFLVEEHGRAVYLHTATGDQAVQIDARIGKISYLHASSAGKAILAHLPEETSAAIIENVPLEAQTQNTIVDKERLREELAAIRDRGYSFNDEESISGLRAVGVPVMGADGRVIGGLSVSGPAHRMKGTWFREEIPDLLLGTANELELNMAYS